jgi:cystathionine beta-synthase
VIEDLLAARGSRELMHVSPQHRVSEAMELMYTGSISQMPVLEAGRPVGSIQEVTLTRLLHDGADLERISVGQVMARPLPQLSQRTHVDEAYRLLMAGNTGVLITDNGVVVDIVTRIDLVRFWNEQRQPMLAA